MNVRLKNIELMNNKREVKIEYGSESYIVPNEKFIWALNEYGDVRVRDDALLALKNVSVK